jgi:putative addiction module component (TIGR02574 family)
MSELAEKLKSDLSRLPVQERAELAHFLIHSLDQGEDPDAEIAWDAELAKREQKIRTGTDVGEAIETVLANIRKKYS